MVMSTACWRKWDWGGSSLCVTLYRRDDEEATRRHSYNKEKEV
jgi:2-keto-3-deoxy-galactonokinase